MKYLYLLLAGMCLCATALAQKGQKTRSVAVAQPSAKATACPHAIYLDTLDVDVAVPSLKDTFSLAYDAGHYLRVCVTDCNGTLYVEERLNGSNRPLFKGRYAAVPAPELVSVHLVDPVTGVEKFSERTVFKPLKTGTWQYYGPTGMVTEELDYENGQLKGERSMGDY
ncbi:MAG TPA: hypothetical protein VGC22_09935 [Chitinophaga sp.]